MEWNDGQRFFWGVGALYAADTLWLTLLLWQVLVLTHASVWLAIASAAGAAPTVLVGITGPAWGMRGKLSLWLVGLGLTWAAAAAFLAHTAWALIAAALIQGWISARLIPLSQTLLMSRASADHAPKASSHYEIASRTGIVVGPLLGGVLLTAAGAEIALFVTSVLFLSAAALWWTVDNNGALTQVMSGSSHVAGAWRAIRTDGFLVSALSVRAGSNILWPAFTVAIPLLIQSPWHAHALGYGAVKTLWGISTVAGTIFIVPHLLRRLKVSYFVSWLVTGAAFLAIGASQSLIEALIWVALGALGSPVVHVALDSHIGTEIEPAKRPAVYAIQRLVMAVVNLMGLGLMTGALRIVAPGDALSGAGILMMGASTVGLLLWARRSRPLAQESNASS